MSRPVEPPFYDPNAPDFDPHDPYDTGSVTHPAAFRHRYFAPVEPWAPEAIAALFGEDEEE